MPECKHTYTTHNNSCGDCTPSRQEHVYFTPWAPNVFVRYFSSYECPLLFTLFTRDWKKERENSFPQLFQYEGAALDHSNLFYAGDWGIIITISTFYISSCVKLLVLYEFPLSVSWQKCGMLHIPWYPPFQNESSERIELSLYTLTRVETERQRSTNCPSFWMGMHIHNLLSILCSNVYVLCM